MKKTKKYRKTKNKDKKTKKLNYIFNKKKHKIPLTKFNGFYLKTIKKNKKKDKKLLRKYKTIKKDFVKYPLDYLSIENVFSKQNMNQINFKPIQYIKRQIVKENKKNKDKLDYIKNEVNKEYNKIIHKNKKLVKKIYNEYLDRDYDYIKRIHDTNFSHNLYKIKEKKNNYPRIVFETNCGKHIPFFDFNVIAKNYDYFKVQDITIHNDYFIFTADLYGINLFHIFIKHIHENKIYDLSIHTKKKYSINVHKYFNIISSNCTGNVVCKDNKIYFISINPNQFSYNRLMCYDINTKKIKTIFKLNNPEFFLTVFKKSDTLFLSVSRYDGASIQMIDDNDKIHTIKPFRKDYNYEIEKFNNTYYLLELYQSTNKIYKTNNFKTKELLHKSNNKHDIYSNLYLLNDKYLLTTCNRLNELFLVITNTCNKKTKFLKILTNKALNKNSKNHHLTNKELYSIKYLTTPNSDESNDLYIRVNSYLFPEKILYVHLEREVMHLVDENPKKLIHSFIQKTNETVLNLPFNENKYDCKIIFIPNSPKIAVYLMFKKGLKINNKNKCFLTGYNAYGYIGKPNYLSKNGGAMYYASLMDRDFIVAHAYTRGSSFGGYSFYRDGRKKNRINVYKDFIQISKYLIDQKITEPERFVIYGRSAGGLLMGNVINMNPELYKLAILGVPFVTPEKTMSNKKNPLAFESHCEFGNPFDKKELKMIREQSPYLQIKKDKLYPNIFIYANMYDTATPYSQGYEYYHKLKECDVFKNKKRELIYFLNNKHGHNQSSKHLESKNEMACFFSVILHFIK